MWCEVGLVGGVDEALDVACLAQHLGRHVFVVLGVFAVLVECALRYTHLPHEVEVCFLDGLWLVLRLLAQDLVAVLDVLVEARLERHGCAERLGGAVMPELRLEVADVGDEMYEPLERRLWLPCVIGPLRDGIDGLLCAEGGAQYVGLVACLLPDGEGGDDALWLEG